MTVIDVTDEYIAGAMPGQGIIKKEPGYLDQDHKEERGVAAWLVETFGGDVTLVKSFADKEYADFRWGEQNRLWELKTPTKEKSINKRIQKALSQIYELPGGIILDVKKLKLPLSKIEYIVQRRMETSMTRTTDIIYINGTTLIKILRYKK